MNRGFTKVGKEIHTQSEVGINKTYLALMWYVRSSFSWFMMCVPGVLNVFTIGREQSLPNRILIVPYSTFSCPELFTM